MPIFPGGNVAEELKCLMRQVCRASLKELVRTRFRGVGRVRTLNKRKAVKGVLVDKAHSTRIELSGEVGRREQLIKEEKETGLDRGAYPGVLIPGFQLSSGGGC